MIMFDAVKGNGETAATSVQKDGGGNRGASGGGG